MELKLRLDCAQTAGASRFLPMRVKRSGRWRRLSALGVPRNQLELAGRSQDGQAQHDRAAPNRVSQRLPLWVHHSVKPGILNEVDCAD